MIGDILRQERERQQLTVKDIEVGTSIRGLYIESIEKGEFDKLPGEVYTKGFIRNYASFLKLDPQSCIDQYVKENHPWESVAEVSPTGKGLDDAGKNDISRQRKRKSGSRYGVAVAALILVAVLGGGAYFLLGGDGSASRTTSTEKVQQEKKQGKVTAKISPTKVTDPIPVEKTEQTQPAAQPTQPVQPADQKPSDVQVTATFTDRCWTRVIADGQTVYEGTAEPGKIMSWKGNEKVIITAGNAGAVEFTHNGKQIGKAGDIGQVVDKVFTRDSVN